MLRKKTNEQQKSKPSRKQRNESIKLGDELRHCFVHQTIQTQGLLGRAKEIIRFHGDDPLVINAQGQMFLTPIFKAVSHGHFEMAELIEQAKGFDPNHRDCQDYNILLFMMSHLVSKFHHPLIKQLIERPDMDLFATTKKRRPHGFKEDSTLPKCRGASALFLATTHPELFQYIPFLLERLGAHANVYVECKMRSSSINYYVEQTPIGNLVNALHTSTAKDINRPMIVDCIRRMAELPMPESNKKKQPRHPRDHALANAALHGDSELVQLLLQLGADKHVPVGDMTLERWADLNERHQLAQQIRSFGVGEGVFQPPLQRSASITGMFAQSAVVVGAQPPVPVAPPLEGQYQQMPMVNSIDGVQDASAPPAADIEEDDVQVAKQQSLRM